MLSQDGHSAFDGERERDDGMEWEITPYVGLGPLRLGMTVQEVHALVEGHVRQARLRDSDIPPDVLVGLGITVGYRHPCAVEFIQCAGSAQPVFQGRMLLGQPYRDLKEFFAVLDPAVQTDATGLRSSALGIALYAPSAEKEPDEPVEAVSLFERGYYDRYL